MQYRHRKTGRVYTVAAGSRRQLRFAARKRVWEQVPDDVPSRADGVYHVGGGWHEVVVGGEVIDKVRGKEVAEAALEAARGS